MNKDKAKITLQKIEVLLEELKSDLGEEIQKNNALNLNKNNKKRKRGPAKSIQDLIHSGFFDSPKTLTDILTEFKKQALNYDKRIVSTELARTVRKQLLSRDGIGGNKNPWKYQKR